MSRISIDEIGKFEQAGAGEIPYFNVLKDDKDTAIVRLMYEHEEEFGAYVVHQVEVTNQDGKDFTRYVGCLAPSGEPCPLCNAGYFRQFKIYIHMILDGEYSIWERGKTMIPKIQGLFPRYGRGEDGLWNREFEVQRNGAKGDTSTSYEFYPLDPDNKTKADFADIVPIKVEGSIILKWNAQQMADHLNGIDVYNAGRDDAPKKENRGAPRQQSRPRPPAANDREVF